MQRKLPRELDLSPFDVAGAREDRERGIFREARIGEREFAEKKDGTAVRCYPACVSAPRAEAFGAVARFLSAVLSVSHESRIRRRVPDCKKEKPMRDPAINENE
jgi:hypothetical protein